MIHNVFKNLIRNNFKFKYSFIIHFKILFIFIFLVYIFFSFSYLNFLFNLFTHHKSKLKKLYDNKISIFTFWEPSSNIPGYLQLCMNTWKINMPDIDIIILDYSNLHLYLKPSIISKILYKRMTLVFQSDAIRIAILEKYGGIWMDMDTIITNKNFLKNIIGYDLAFFGYPHRKYPATGFIYASKNSKIIKEWLINIIKRVSFYKKSFKLGTKDFSKISHLFHWDYLGNGIINQLLQKAKEKEYIIFDWAKTNAMPELNIQESRKKKSFRKLGLYRKLYFLPGDPKNIIYNNPGIIFLHNSWTEKKYKYMSKNTFLKQNIMLSSLLKSILKKSNIK